MSYVGNVPTTAAFPFDQFSGDGSTTAFTLSYAPAGSTSIIVSISGVVQNPNTYSVSGTTITFSPAPPSGTSNIAVLYLGLPVVASMTGTMEFIAGSATNPPIYPTGDTNTGIYFPGADRIGFTEGGTQVGEFDSSANFKFNSGYGSVATAYGCRAWVNFNGTGTVAIRASGNVSSITDNGTGDYTVNFTTAMSDANYGSSVYAIDLSGYYTMPIGIGFSKTTSSYRIGTIGKNNSATVWSAYTADFPNVDVAIFR